MIRWSLKTHRNFTKIGSTERKVKIIRAFSVRSRSENGEKFSQFQLLFQLSNVRKCTLVVYHSQNVSGKPGWKVNGTRRFGSFQRKISGSNGTYFFRTVFHIFKAIFDTSFRLRGRFLVVEMICTYGKRNSGMKFTSSEFCLPFPQTVNRSVCP